MADYRSLPAWRQAVGLAHTVCAALEAACAREGEAGVRIRRAALSIPSLVADAFLDQGRRDPAEVLAEAACRVAEVRELVEGEPCARRLSEADRTALLAEIDALGAEIEAAARRIGGAAA